MRGALKTKEAIETCNTWKSLKLQSFPQGHAKQESIAGEEETLAELATNCPGGSKGRTLLGYSFCESSRWRVPFGDVAAFDTHAPAISYP